jgi:ribosomal protein S18 acetylase RimI-like enzyme
VRSFVEPDGPAVLALWRDAFPGDPPRNEPGLVIRRKMGVQPELFLVAVAEDEVAGAVLGGYDGFRGWLYHLAVRSDRRGRGIGRALVEALEDRLREMGCPKLNLQVRARNAAVVGFYERLGYDVEDHVSMGKLLE